MNNLVEMKNITKRFPGVIALDKVDFQLVKGEVHVLLGENGAGKSTLMKILSGIYEPSAGEIVFDDKVYHKLTPNDSAENKIGIIYQELSVINELSIAENLFVNRLPTKNTFLLNLLDKKMLEDNTKKLLKVVGLNRSPSTFVKNLSISEKQLVEIAKALSQNANIIIMDEPTSSLTLEETEKLFTIINQLKEDGKGIVYITHKMNEIEKIADRVTVLKDGKAVGTKYVSETSTNELISMMVGRKLSDLYPQVEKKSICCEELLKVKNLTRKDNKVKDISFELKKGEILGFSGLVGAGRTELMCGVFGADPIKKGEVYIKGEKVDLRNPYVSIKNGIAMMTESRRESGFFPNFQVCKNISIVPLIKQSKIQGLWGLTKPLYEKNIAEEQKNKLGIRCTSIEQSITDLSGGNQQKVILGKWLAAESEIFILDEPTRGIDVGAKREIYLLMRELANKGKGVIMVSSELPELIGMCDRIIVFSEGKISGEVKRCDATEEKIIQLAMLED